MKTLTISIILLLIFSSTGFSQGYEPSEEEIAANLRHEKCKKDFINENYDNVVEYYDSISLKKSYLPFELYKMVSESCIIMAENNADSITLISKSKTMYDQAERWYGSMRIKDWDSLKIEIYDEPEIFRPVDEQPEPNGGMAAFYKYVGQEMKYPEEARRMGIEGRVFVQFVVNKDGSLDAVNAIKGIGGGCDEEAVRVIRNAKNWTPGKQDGKPVYVRMILPMTFKLTGKPKKKKKRS